MRFRGQMHDGVRLMLRENPVQQVPVGDIALFEDVAVAGQDLVQAAQVGGIGQLVEIDDLVRGMAQAMADQARPDKARSTGDQYAHLESSLLNAQGFSQADQSFAIRAANSPARS